MKSIKRELNTVKHRMNMNQIRIMLADNVQENRNLSPLNLNKHRQYNLVSMNNSGLANCILTTRSCQNNSLEYTQRKLSLNSPAQANKKQDSFSQDFFPFTNKNLKNRSLSSLQQSPKIRIINKANKSQSQINEIKKIISQSQENSFQCFKKQDDSNFNNRTRTEYKIIKQKREKIEYDSTMYNFLQGQLGSLYSNRQLTLNKPNLNLQQRSFGDNSLNDINPQSLDLNIKQKKEIKQQIIEDEYQLEKKKEYDQSKLYFKKMYTIQKSALNQYLNGEEVEPQVIKYHTEIMNPLKAYVQQKQRENQQKHKQNLNKNFIKKNNKPIFESRFTKSQSKNSVQMYKSDVNQNNSSQLNNEKRNQKLSNMKSIQQLINKQKQQNEIESNFNTFMKGEKNYFDILENIYQKGEKEFITEMHVRQKYHFEQQMEPQQQYLTKQDMKIEKNIQVLKSLLQKIQSQKSQIQQSNSNQPSAQNKYNHPQ